MLLPQFVFLEKEPTSKETLHPRDIIIYIYIYIYYKHHLLLIYYQLPQFVLLQDIIQTFGYTS